MQQIAVLELWRDEDVVLGEVRDRLVLLWHLDAVGVFQRDTLEFLDVVGQSRAV